MIKKAEESSHRRSQSEIYRRSPLLRYTNSQDPQEENLAVSLSQEKRNILLAWHVYLYHEIGVSFLFQKHNKDNNIINKLIHVIFTFQLLKQS